MIDPEAKRAGIEKLIKVGVVAVVAAATYSIAWYAVLGLVGWLAVGAVALTAVNFAPVFATWVANKRIQALIAVIEANPIETMQNLYSDKKVELDNAANNIRDFETYFNNFKSQVREVRKQPDITEEDITEYVEIETKMEALLEDMKSEQTSATGELAAFLRKIRKGQTLYELAKSANAMLEKSGTAQQAVYAQIKEQVSFDKVRTDLNRAFANLNSTVERRKNAALFSAKAPAKALPPAVEVTDITPKALSRSGVPVNR